jgi:uncharacterized protein YciI
VKRIGAGGYSLEEQSMDSTQMTQKRFVYFYFNRDDPPRIRQCVPAHVEYWRSANLKGYEGGPFTDRSGGLISFAAASLDEATALILADPFVVENLVSQSWIKEWIVE